MIGDVGGTVVAARGPLVEADMPRLCIGAGARITTRAGRRIAARVTALDGRRAILTPFDGIAGIAVGDRVTSDPMALAIPLGMPYLGRAIDALGVPLDGRAAPHGARRREAGPMRSSPADRVPVTAVFETGVQALDAALAFGVGARIGIFGLPGCGKSTLLSSIVAASSADVTVVGLIGERGREAERWIAAIDARTTVVCATSERSAGERVRAAEVAFAQADALRRRGLDVLLVIDSIARVAAAARDLALATGEAVGRGGYPSSVFGFIARLLESTGNFTTGSTTLVATVLSDGADEHDPVSDACRAALDGHIVLSERLARQGWFPAIDIPASASRTLPDIASAAHMLGARRLREAIALLDATREVRSFGLDPGAGDPALRRAIDAEPAIADFLRRSEPSHFTMMLRELGTLTDRLSDGYPR